MKIAYFDCFAGVSGDMILGALIDAGLPTEVLNQELAKLDLQGYTIEAVKSEKKHISGTRFHVDIPHEHHHRTLRVIRDMILKSTLDAPVKEHSIAIFTRLAEAEAKIHNKSVDEVHFHEVGAVDSIIDIVGAAIGFHHLQISRITASSLPTGTGSIQCAHGLLPVPAPATLELLQGIPVRNTNIESELVTPTGAAILAVSCDSFGGMPGMTVERTGYGLGSRDLEIPNLLRIVIGSASGSENMHHDIVQLIETNLDDMNPQFYDHVIERLFEAGALDVFMTQIMMKKNRPGVILSVITEPENVTILSEILFDETTTLGLRISEVKKRKILSREIITVKTPWGEGRAKVRILADGRKTAEPEYRDCKRLARERQIPIQTVYQTIRTEALKQLSS